MDEGGDAAGVRAGRGVRAAARAAIARLRAFVAVHLDADTRAALGAATDGLRARGADLSVSWVAPENFHITVKFLGGIDDDLLPAVIDALRAATAGHRAFDLEVASLGAFPSPTRPRVLWAGVDGGAAPLAAIAAVVDDALAPLGFPRETRAFSAHVTLGRVREPRRAPRLADALAAAASRRFGRVTVDSIALMRSDLSPRGARYTALSTIPLRAA